MWDGRRKTVEAVQQQLQELEAQFQAEVSAAASAAESGNEVLEAVDLRPTRTNINVRLLTLVWLPFSRDAVGVLNRAY